MHRERVSENVFWFQSEVYAQVTAGVVAGPQWAVVIDTLALPDETLSIREFIEHELNVPVRYVINTHYHADHAWGNCFFPGATVIAHERCREYLIERGIPSLEAAQKQNPALRQVKIVLPQMTFTDGEVTLRVGKKNLIISLPGIRSCQFRMLWMEILTKSWHPSNGLAAWGLKTLCRDTAILSCAARSRRQ